MITEERAREWTSYFRGYIDRLNDQLENPFQIQIETMHQPSRVMLQAAFRLDGALINEIKPLLVMISLTPDLTHMTIVGEVKKLPPFQLAMAIRWCPICSVSVNAMLHEVVKGLTSDPSKFIEWAKQ